MLVMLKEGCEKFLPLSNGRHNMFYPVAKEAGGGGGHRKVWISIL